MGKYDKMWFVYDQLVKFNIERNISDYKSAFLLSGATDDPQKALKIFQEAKQRNVLDAGAYTILIEAFAKCKSFKQGWEIFESMHSEKIEREKNLYSILDQSYLPHLDAQQKEKLEEFKRLDNIDTSPKE